jgi:hypothetical protein
MIQSIQMTMGDEIRVKVEGGKTFRLTVGPLLLGVSVPDEKGAWVDLGFIFLEAPKPVEAPVAVETALKEWPTAVEALTENLTGIPEAMVARMTALPGEMGTAVDVEIASGETVTVGLMGAGTEAEASDEPATE